MGYPQGLFAYGTFTAANPAVDHDVDCGFVPDYVRIFNANATAADVTMAEWVRGMGNDAAMVHKVVVDSGSTGDKSSAFTASNGITPLAGTPAVQTTPDPIQITSVKGFTVAAEIQKAAVALYWVAFRADRA